MNEEIAQETADEETGDEARPAEEAEPELPDELSGITASQWADKYARLLAEFDNFRKRSREQGRRQADARKLEFIVELLDVVDSFENALKSLEKDADETPEIASRLDGIAAIDRQLKKLFDKHGVQPIQAVGEPFDPNFHEAVAVLEDGESKAGTVLSEARAGWCSGDSVLRPTRVIVASAPKRPDGAGEAGTQ